MISSGTPRAERLLILFVACTFAVGYALLGLVHHRRFETGFDLAIFDQAIWHLSRFETPASTISGYKNILGDHFHPVLFILSPLYWIAPSPLTLIVAQAILLAVSFWPVYLYLRRRLPLRSSVGLVVAYGLFWGMQRTAWFDFHELAFAPVLIATALLAIDRRSWWPLWMASAALIATKEDMIPMVAAFGLFLVVRGERRQGALLTTSALAAFVLVIAVVIPHFNDGHSWSTGGAFGSVSRSPWRLPLAVITPPEKLVTVVAWFAPFAFLSLLSPVSALLIPVVLERLLSGQATHWAPNFHYSAPLAPLLAMSAADALARLSERPSTATAQRRLRTTMVSTIVVLAAVIPGHQPLWKVVTPGHYARVPAQDIGARALAMIPEHASIVALAAIAPHLTHREHVFVLDADAPDADFVIASIDLSPWPLAASEDIASLLAIRRDRGYTVIFEESGWFVLRRTRP